MEVPDFSLELDLHGRGLSRVAGIDEAGRGPLAGPVTAAAVILDPARMPKGLADSKKLPAARRLELAAEIAEVAEVSVAHASVEEIDALNILEASHLAMARAAAGLSMPPAHLLVDGNRLPRDLPCGADAVVGGDGRCCSIAAAGIVAKVARDAVMLELAQQFPGYGWETNMGYGSKSHIAALQDLGPSPHHRRSFAPVHNILYQAKTITH